MTLKKDLKKLSNGMNAIGTELKDSYVILNKTFGDDRGFFMESFNLEQFRRIVDYDVEFVQDNHSKSSKGVLRGLHYQVKYPQGKLVRCIFGSVYDVIVDIRKSSETFGKWIGVTLNRPDKQLWVPPGFAHGFYTLSDIAEITYKTTDYYHPEYERTILWNDVDLNIDWKISNSLPLLSVKDLEGDTFDICEKF